MPRADASLCVGGALVRPKAGFLCVSRPAGRSRRDARLWLRGFAGLPGRHPCFARPRHGAGVPLRAPCECVESRRRSNRCASGGTREPRMTSRRRRARSTTRSATTSADAPDGRVKAPRRRRAEDVADVRARSCRISAGLRRGVDAPASRASVGRSARLRRSRRRRIRRWAVQLYTKSYAHSVRSEPVVFRALGWAPAPMFEVNNTRGVGLERSIVSVMSI